MLKFVSPLDGTIFHTAGEQNGVKFFAVEGACTLRLNDSEPVKCENGCASLDLPLGESLITAIAENGETAQIHVGHIHTADKIYRLSVDDNIWFLQDIARHADTYRSIFENPLLGMLRRLHDEYGTAVHMNIYWECPEHGGFCIKDMPDCFREEWLANRNWLHLSFHAKADKPDRPYLNADYAQVKAECGAVMREIERFAGAAGEITTLHWAMATQDGIRGLYDCGVRAMLADFAYNPDDGQEWLCYNANHEQFDNVRKYVFWKDPETNMILFPCDVVLNTMSPEEIVREMDWFAETWKDRNFVDILIHEQYFYPDYRLYEPDYEQRIRAGIEWCKAHGYKPGLASDVLGLK